MQSYLTITGTTTLGQSGLGSNGYEGVFYIFQSSRTGTSSSDPVYCHIKGACWEWGGVLHDCIDIIGIFYSPRWLG